jgi:hypothetical protein
MIGKKTNIIIGILIVVSFFSCGKYEDGPLFSLATRKGRVSNEWKVNQYFENNQNVTEDFFKAYKEYNFIFERNGNAQLKFIETGNPQTNTIQGSWEFDSTQEFIFLDTPEERYELKILRLKRNQLWIEYENSFDALVKIHLH